MKEVLLYRKTEKGNVQCLNCAHYCQIAEGKTGICGTRKNENGKLYSLNYGKLVAVNIDPIEKKPFYHFLPGTYSLSIASAGCNFKCLNCQNWAISQAPFLKQRLRETEISPEEIVNLAIENKLPSISYTYTEPAVFSEYALDVMKIAKEKDIKNAWVSNGFWSEELFEMVSPYIDAANIDLKGFSEEFYSENCKGKLMPVLETLKRLKEKNIWTEITFLVIPSLNDSEEIIKGMASFIKKELSAETPLHISRFFPEVSWKLTGSEKTPLETLENAYHAAKEIGLKNVYIGNAPEMKKR
jgi:pyruvate formate lyase activating enzyme